jgi:hypothetical protein
MSSLSFSPLLHKRVLRYTDVMLYTLALTHVKRALACAQLLPRQTIARRYKNTKSSEALRILFCGSDEFSIRSLEAIHKLHLADPTLISSIDVVSRPPKPYGRGLKKIREGKPTANHPPFTLAYQISPHSRGRPLPAPASAPNRHLHRLGASRAHKPHHRRLVRPAGPASPALGCHIWRP